MKKLFWRIRYAFVFSRRADCSLRLGWDCSEAGWEMSAEDGLSPSDAVDEELSYWTDDEARA